MDANARATRNRSVSKDQHQDERGVGVAIERKWERWEEEKRRGRD